MEDNVYVASVVLVAASITFALRAAPFAMLRFLHDSAVMGALRARMPVGVLVILAATLLGDAQLNDPRHGLATASALGATIVAYRVRGNGTLGVLVGTTIYVLVLNILAS